MEPKNTYPDLEYFATHSTKYVDARSKRTAPFDIDEPVLPNYLFGAHCIKPLDRVHGINNNKTSVVADLKSETPTNPISIKILDIFNKKLTNREDPISWGSTELIEDHPTFGEILISPIACPTVISSVVHTLKLDLDEDQSDSDLIFYRYHTCKSGKMNGKWINVASTDGSQSKVEGNESPFTIVGTIFHANPPTPDIEWIEKQIAETKIDKWIKNKKFEFKEFMDDHVDNIGEAINMKYLPDWMRRRNAASFTRLVNAIWKNYKKISENHESNKYQFFNSLFSVISKELTYPISDVSKEWMLEKFNEITK